MNNVMERGEIDDLILCSYCMCRLHFMQRTLHTATQSKHIFHMVLKENFT